jgi:hypothetical protein
MDMSCLVKLSGMGMGFGEQGDRAGAWKIDQSNQGLSSWNIFVVELVYGKLKREAGGVVVLETGGQ